MLDVWRITTPEFLETYSVKIISFSISLYCVWQQLIRDNLWPWKQQLKVNIVYSRATLHTGQVISGLTPAVWGIAFLLELCVLQIVSDNYHSNSLMPELGQLIWCPCYLKRFFNAISEQICGINSVLMSGWEHHAKLKGYRLQCKARKNVCFLIRTNAIWLYKQSSHGMTEFKKNYKMHYNSNIIIFFVTC